MQWALGFSSELSRFLDFVLDLSRQQSPVSILLSVFSVGIMFCALIKRCLKIAGFVPFVYQ